MYHILIPGIDFSRAKMIIAEHISCPVILRESSSDSN